MTDRPAMLASSSTPRATSVKNGLATSRTTRPIVRLRPARSWRADSFLTNPRALIAAFTRSRVDGATMSGRFSTLETVPTETPACAATSLMLMGALTRTSRGSPGLQAREESGAARPRSVAGVCRRRLASCCGEDCLPVPGLSRPSPAAGAGAHVRLCPGGVEHDPGRAPAPLAARTPGHSVCPDRCGPDRDEE